MVVQKAKVTSRRARPAKARTAPDRNDEERRGRQILRQWKILRGLEASRRGLTVAELRAVVDEPCTARTLYRDLEQLEQAGFPIVKTESRWQILSSGAGAWNLPIDPTQVLALRISEELLKPLQGSWLAQPLESLRARISAMLTPQARAYVEELRTSAVATLFGAGTYEARDEILTTLHEAIEKQHRLRIRYAAPGRPRSERTVDPYSTWYAQGRAYLIAFCHKAKDYRTFELHRFESAETLDEPFEPDPSFSAASFVKMGFGVYHGPVHDIVIDFDAEVAHLVRERRYHDTQAIEEHGSGVRVRMRAAGLPEIAAWLAGFGGRARPVAPAELVDQVASIHRRGLEALGRAVTSDVKAT